MTVHERLRLAIDEQRCVLRATVPGDRQAAILAVLHAQERVPEPPNREPAPDIVTGRRLANLGANLALHLSLAADGEPAPGTPANQSAPPPPPSAPPAEDLDGWSQRLLDACTLLAEAELVLAHGETGFMQVVEDRPGTFDAWITTKRAPTVWRERADFDWWAAALARHHQAERRALEAARPNAAPADPAGPGTFVIDPHYRQLADLHLSSMAYQPGYPPDADLGGCTMQTYRDVLAQLIARALRARDRGEAAAPQSERSLVAALALALAADPATVGQAVAAFTVGQENAAYHAAVAGVAAAPLVRLDGDRVVWSLHGLLTEPILFLTRELKRRLGAEYHNAAFLREGLFRQDLYALFSDRRFVTSTSRIELRRAAGDVRTDVDAAVFDRKTGTLALFEIKSQDPFARSTAELVRQRDNILYANRQISGVLAWMQQHGADALLARFDARTARTFRVHKVYPFVLGRYLAHFNDGAEPDRRAAWGTWPQVLRLLDSQPVRAKDANPIASLFSRLSKDVPVIAPPAGGPPREIEIGAARLTVHPSFAAYRASASR
jgi:hypothetical protein